MISPLEYIESGILELYVAGLLQTDEIEEVQRMADEFPIIQKEIDTLIIIYQVLPGAVAPTLPANQYEIVKKYTLEGVAYKIKNNSYKDRNFLRWMFWVMVFFMLGYILVSGTYMYNKSIEMENVVRKYENTTQNLDSLVNINQNKNKIIDQLRDTNYYIINLEGQTASPNSFARLYWQRESKSIFVDAKGLPTPPVGMTYQVWALNLFPLTAINLGTLNTFELNQENLYELGNIEQAEAFGITLESEGGSDIPSLAQLFVLGKF